MPTLKQKIYSIILVTVLLIGAGTYAVSLSDYGAIPTLSKPAGDQSAANQKLDFHTDLFTGRFAYQVPISVPPARQGTQPGPALQYNSANKDGWCGVGWDLDMGFIERETRYGVPVSGTNYSDSFGFTFSAAGQSGRLINVAGTNDYRPQINSAFLKFNYSNGWWIITDKSGRKYNFGETTASRITNSFGAFKWGLSSIRDANGNKTLLTYTNDSGQMYLSRIDYNANDNSPAIATNCTIAFDLETTNRLDIVSTVISGKEIQTTRRLSNIRVLSQGQLVRRYGLQYVTSSSTGKSLLQKVTEYGSDNSSALPAHTFSYTIQSPTFQPTNAWPIVSQTFGGDAYGSSPATAEAQLIDMNGDGLPDRVTRTNDAGVNYYNLQLNTGSGFGSVQTHWASLPNEGSDGTTAWNGVDSSLLVGSFSTATSQLLDLDGDNLPDRVVRQYSTSFDHFRVQLNSGTGLGSASSWTGVTSANGNYPGDTLKTPSVVTSDGISTLAILADMNGDGLPDRVMAGGTSGQFDVQLNQQGSFATISHWTAVAATFGDPVPNAPRVRDYSHVYSELIDLNGDGLPDRVIQGAVYLNNGVSGFGGNLNWGLGASEDPEVVDGTSGYYPKQLLDINGDGLPDLVTQLSSTSYSVQFNTGRGFSSSSTTWSGVDSTSNGSVGWDALQSWDANGTRVIFVDINGDGLLDRVKRNPNGDINSYLFVQLSTGPFPDLLTNVDNGIGGDVGVTYQPSTVLNNSDGTRPRLPFPVYVATSVTTSDGRGNSATTSYDYAGGYYDTTYREFRGFAVVTETDALGAYTTTWFHQGGGTNGSALGEYNDDLAKAGMPYRTEVYGSDSKFYSRTLSKVDEVKLHTNGVYFPFVRQTIKEDFEGNTGATAYRATASSYGYNVISNNLGSSTGNLLAETNFGEVASVVISNHTFTTGVSGAPQPVYRQFTYATITGNADIIDRVAVATVSADGAGTVVLQQTTNQYYDVTGDLKLKAERICAGTFAVSTFGYDAYGNPTGSTNSVGIVSTTIYDAATATFPIKKYTGALGDNLIEYAQYDSRSGAVLAGTNVQGLVTANAYDVFFRLTNSAISTSQFGTANLTRTKIEYKLGGISTAGVSTNYVRTLKNDPSDPSGFHESYAYLDGLGRPIQSREQSETNGVYRVGNIIYDDRGSVKLEAYPIFSSGSAYTKIASGTVTNYVYTEYDAIGRAFRVNPIAKATITSGGIWNGTAPVAITGDSGSPTGPSSIAFKDGTNSWAIIVTNALSKIHKYYLDAYGRTNLIIEVTSQGNYTNYLGYNLLSSLTNLTDSASNQIGFFFNDVGQKVAEADPDRGFWQYGLDAGGRLKTQTDAKSNLLQFSYTDPAGRLMTRLGFNPQGVLSSVLTNVYDSSAGDAAYTVYPGQVFMTIDDEGWTKHSYDVRGREVKTVRYLAKNGQTYVTPQTWDDADRLIAMTYPNGGPTVTNIFDTGGHLCQVKLVGGAATLFYDAQSFDELGRPRGINFGNSTASSYGFYAISKRLNQLVTTSHGTNVQSLTYKYNPLGSLTDIADNITGHTGGASASMTNAVYDDLDRLTQAGWTGYGLKNFAYDKVGNVLTNGESGTGAYSYGTIRPHFVRSANGVWFTSDQNGNVVFRGGQRLEYNVNNELSLVLSTNGTLTKFGYGAGGERLWKSSSTNSLQVWIGGGYEEKNGQVLYHIVAAGRLVCTFDSTGTNVLQYYHPDHLTSSSIQTDSTGAVIQHYEYSAFGQSRYTQNSTAFPVSRRYTSQVLDEDTGLCYYNFRYYDPQLGRFLQPDDIIAEVGDPQSWNRYSYCLNNPLRYTDPSGHWFFVAPLLYAAATYGAGQVGAAIYVHSAEVSGNAAVMAAQQRLDAKVNEVTGGKFTTYADYADRHGTSRSAWAPTAVSPEFVSSAGALGAMGGEFVLGATTTIVPEIKSSAALLENAATKLPQMKGMGTSEREGTLLEAGFNKTKVSNSPGKNETWIHPDGSEVKIHPYGDVKQGPFKSGNNAHMHKSGPDKAKLNDRGFPSSDPNQTHIGLPNPKDFPDVRKRPSGS
jgi:RHS repeat-associated protein